MRTYPRSGFGSGRTSRVYARSGFRSGGTSAYPYPMVWPLPRPWSETMVSIIPLWALPTYAWENVLSLVCPFRMCSRRPRAQGVGVDPCLLNIRQEKRAQRLSFRVRRPPGGVGVFHAKGWWPKTSCPPSKLCLPWVSKRGIRDVPGILPGCPGPLAVFKKFVQKNFVRIFRSLEYFGLFLGAPCEPREFKPYC